MRVPELALVDREASSYLGAVCLEDHILAPQIAAISLTELGPHLRVGQTALGHVLASELGPIVHDLETEHSFRVRVDVLGIGPWVRACRRPGVVVFAGQR